MLLEQLSSRGSWGDKTIWKGDIMVATKRSLVSRWASPEGQERANAIVDALKRATSATELTKILAGFDCADEIAPALDLRGIQLSDIAPVRYLDLSGARLDYATV